MTMLRKPGSCFPVHLPCETAIPEDERMVVWIRVPTQAAFLEIEDIASRDISSFETARQIIGLSVDRIDNLSYPDGKPFELDREKSGFLTVKCAEWINPYLNDLAGLILNTPRLTEIERKNS